MPYHKAVMKILLNMLLVMGVIASGVAPAQDGTPNEPKKVKKSGEDSAEQLPKVPAALKEKKFVNSAKLNTKAKVYFIYKSRYACAICVAEAPSIVDTYKKMKGKKVELVMLNIDADKATAEKWVKGAKMVFPVVAPGDAGGVPFPYEYSSPNAGTLPQMVAVDAQGNKLGQANGSEVAEFLKTWKKILKEYEKNEKKEAMAAKKAAKTAEEKREPQDGEE